MLSITWKDKAVRTPKGNALQVPYGVLAKALQAEWDACEKPTPNAMPLTARAASVIDILPEKRDQIQADASNYIDADVLCYFADNDSPLIDYQHASWDKHLHWVSEELKAKVQTTCGISHIKQNEDYHKAATAILTEPDDWNFYALQNFIIMSHSFILGYRLYIGNITAEESVFLSCADSLYQEKQWGSDAEAVANRQALIDEMQDVQNYLLLLKD